MLARVGTCWHVLALDNDKQKLDEAGLCLFWAQQFEHV